jgi:hypothetical protein
LGGEGRGTRQDENVFNIQTPVAIAIAVRYGAPDPNTPAQVHYCRIKGTRATKLEKLESIQSFKDLSFETCSNGWQEPFRPRKTVVFFDWPQLDDLMPWQTSGAQIKRKWPIGTTSAVLKMRWAALLSSADRATAFKETRDLEITSVVTDMITGEKLQVLADLSPDEAVPLIQPYGYRSFDRQWLIADPRLADYLRPPLWDNHSATQIYFATVFSQPLDLGPALTLSAYIPDLHFFRGSYGGKDIFPLYRDAHGEFPNLHPALSVLLKVAFGKDINAEDIAAYLYAVLAHPGYAARFHAELENRHVHVPITLDKELFSACVAIGQRLIYLHSYGQRYVQGQAWPRGRARCTRAIPTEGLPEQFSYDETKQILHVGMGRLEPVSPAIWELEVSGLKVVESWLGYRMKNPKGKKSSPLDDITPSHWPAEFTSELLRLLHLLEETLEFYPQQTVLLDQIISGPLLDAAQLGPPPKEYRKPFTNSGKQQLLQI